MSFGIILSHELANFSPEGPDGKYIWALQTVVSAFETNQLCAYSVVKAAQTIYKLMGVTSCFNEVLLMKIKGRLDVADKL